MSYFFFIIFIIPKIVRKSDQAHAKNKLNKKKILKTKKKIKLFSQIKMQERCKQSCGQKVPVTLWYYQRIKDYVN